MSREREPLCAVVGGVLLLAMLAATIWLVRARASDSSEPAGDLNEPVAPAASASVAPPPAAASPAFVPPALEPAPMPAIQLSPPPACAKTGAGWREARAKGTASLVVAHSKSHAQTSLPAALSEDELRRRLDAVPELTVHLVEAALQNPKDATANKRKEKPLRDSFLKAILKDQPELAGLPLRKGLECQLIGREAVNLASAACGIRIALAAMEENGADAGISILATHLTENGVPALEQILMAENTDLRLFLVQGLGQINVYESTSALARRAVFDLSPKVRAAAVAALKERESNLYGQVLVDALRHPWPPVASNAAEAIVALELRHFVPQLEAMLKAPDPSAPSTGKVDGKETVVVREMVRLNHLRNCLFCHSPSSSRTDAILGRAPLPSEEPPPGGPTSPAYYDGDNGIFVRADVTYLRQDFSLMQRVENPGKWPAQQRFDFLVRTRPATEAEIRRHEPGKADSSAPSPHRQAILYALQELRRPVVWPAVEPARQWRFGE